MKKIALFSRFSPNIDFRYLWELLEAVEASGYKIVTEHNFATYARRHYSFRNGTDIFQGYKDLPRDAELFLTYGGDGTILRAATIIRDTGIPIMGVNAGRLGFLADIPKENVLTAWQKYLEGAFFVQARSLLSAQTDPAIKFVKEINFALNELTITRKDTTSMINVEVYVDDEFLSTYWADGLIVATPTGSTGYSLSCGGPILTPDTKDFIITAIAPHNLTVRPLVLPDHHKIKLVAHGREKQFLLSLDSRVTTVPYGTEIHISRASFKLMFIRLEDYTFIRTLRRKLFWGYDNRNT